MAKVRSWLFKRGFYFGHMINPHGLVAHVLRCAWWLHEELRRAALSLQGSRCSYAFCQDQGPLDTIMTIHLSCLFPLTSARHERLGRAEFANEAAGGDHPVFEDGEEREEGEF